MSTDLKISISGIRGIVGQSLTLDRLIGWIRTWEEKLPEGPIVLARDARPHGGALLQIAAGALEYAGRQVIVAGLVPTPTVGVLVRHHKAAGGVMLTASHNPVEWNALKIFNQDGLILTPAEFAELEPVWNNLPPVSSFAYKPGGSTVQQHDALDAHIDLVFQRVDRNRIAKQKFNVAVDGCRSVGGIALTRILREAGVAVYELDCTPDGKFTRGLEPIPENLTRLGEVVREKKADLGMAVDPDADRLALVDGEGNPIGEEYTLVLAADAVLGAGGKGLVANLSSTLLLDRVAEKHGSPMHRSKVGESHVVDLIRETGSTIGGEGNGGVILPSVQPGRDSLAGALLVLDLLAREGKTLAEAVESFPRTAMVKDKLPATEGLWEKLEKAAETWWSGVEVNRLDGIKWVWEDRWLHLRSSNTEPILRILAEGPDEETTQALVNELKGKIESA
jgi:phosphomannomutase